jgi:predicted transcriptional regulator
MTASSHTTSAQLASTESHGRLNVLDFAEAANIPVATARRLMKQFGNDAATLMRALATQATAPQMSQSAPRISQQQ